MTFAANDPNAMLIIVLYYCYYQHFILVVNVIKRSKKSSIVVTEVYIKKVLSSDIHDYILQLLKLVEACGSYGTMPIITHKICTEFLRKILSTLFISIFCCLDCHEDTKENFAKSKSMLKRTRFNLTDNDFDAAKKLDGKYIL